MALLQIDFYSEALKRNVPMNVILPVEKTEWDLDERKYQTLYLLNGLKKDHNEWLTYSRIFDYATRKKIAVVMPAGGNSFYVDLELPDNDYGVFVGRDMVEFTRKILPLSRRREDTFLCGASMGGFGALRNGLKYYDTFGYVAGFSPAIHIFELPVGHPDRHMVFQEDTVMGDLEAARLTDKNPRVAVENMLAAAKRDPSIQLPKIFLICGLQDSLLTADRSFRDFLLSKGVDVTYYESEGGHNWDFWDPYLRKLLDWLPLEENGSAASLEQVDRAYL